MKSSKAVVLSLFAGAGIFLTILGGCANHSRPTVRISSWGDVKENIILSDLITEFKKTHPDIEVQLLRVSWDEYLSKLLTQFAAGNAPDVIFVSTDDIHYLAGRGMLENLDDYIKKSPDFPLNDMWPVVIKNNTLNGHLYVVPRDIDLQCDFYYNKKAFDEAGIPYPKDDWTWKEFMADCKALTKRNAKGNTVRWGFVDDIPRLEPWIYSGGAHWVDDSYHPTKWTFNTPEMIRALQFRADMIVKEKVMPSLADLKTNGDVGSSAMFIHGGVGIFFSGLWHTPEFRDIKDFDWDIAMAPLGPDGKRAFGIGGSGYGILHTSKNKDAAWELVKFIAGVEGEKKMAETGLVIPALQSVANSPSFLDDQRPRNKRAFFKVIDKGVLRPRAMNWREIEEGTIMPTLDRVWEGVSTVPEAVSILNEKLPKIPLVPQPPEDAVQK